MFGYIHVSIFYCQNLFWDAMYIFVLIVLFYLMIYIFILIVLFYLMIYIFVLIVLFMCICPGISPPDFDNQTLAVLRGRLVRYLMRSREVNTLPAKSLEYSFSHWNNNTLSIVFWATHTNNMNIRNKLPTSDVDKGNKCNESHNLERYRRILQSPTAVRKH